MDAILITQSRDYDAVVVGAGPAGSIAARELARAGIRKILLVDKSTFPRNKVCGCCLNGRAIRALEQAGLSQLVKSLHAVTLDRFRMIVNGHSAELCSPLGIAVSRCDFDHALIQEALKEGVEFLDGTRAKAGNSEPNFREVLLIRDGTRSQIHAGVVVVADGLAGGFFPQPERAQPSSGSRLGAGTSVESKDEAFPFGTIMMVVGAGGYVGIVRLTHELLNIAAAFDPEFVSRSGSLGVAAKTILFEAGAPDIEGLESDWRGTPLLTRESKTVTGDDWFSIGDSSGYVEPFTGEGMSWAITSAIAVAPIVVQRILQLPGAHRAKWQLTYRRLIRDRRSLCRVLAWSLRSQMLSSLLTRLLANAPILARPILRGMNPSGYVSPRPFQESR